MFVPEVRRIVGTSFSATSLEDGSGYRIGNLALLSSAGRGSIVANGAMFRIWEDQGTLWGRRFDQQPHGMDSAEAYYTIGLATRDPILSEDDEDTAAHEGGTQLEVGGGSFPVDSFYSNRLATSVGEQIVLDVRDEVLELRNRAHALYVAFNDNDSYDALLAEEWIQLWDDVEVQIQRIFEAPVAEWNTLVQARKSIKERENVIEQFDAVVAALSSVAAFQEATRKSGGIFRHAEKGETGAFNLFNAPSSRSAALLEAMGDMRFGAVRTATRRRGIAEMDLAVGAPGGLTGVFAYSVIPDTEETAEIALSGDAIYRGRTTAIDGEGNFYRGDIELEIRFSNDSVHALVTNLSTGPDQSWIHRRKVVEGILLPSATLQLDADWTASSSRSNSALIVYEDLFASVFPERRTTFAGHLLGVSWNAGHQAVGSWSVGEEGDRTDYLAGAFGAVFDDAAPDREEPEPITPSEEAASQTEVVPAGTEIRNGILTLRGTLFGPNPDTVGSAVEWDDERRVLIDGQRIEDVYEVSLEAALARSGAPREYLGANLLTLALEEIGQLRDDLAVVTDLGDSPLALQERARIWTEVNEAVRDRIFGTADKAPIGKDFAGDESVPPTDPRKWSNGYPAAPDGSPDDVAALEAIDAVVAALASPEALVRGVTAGGGVFTRTDGTPFRPLAAGQIAEIWDRAEGRLRMWLESTDHTRFGAWMKQTAPNAWAEYRDRTADDENGPSAFAFSPLTPSSYRDYRFPVGGTSIFNGRTVAVQGKTFFSGSMELVAQWQEPQRGQYNVGFLDAVISQLRTPTGELPSYARTDRDGTVTAEISEISFGGIRIGLDGDDQLYFSDQLPESLTLTFHGSGTAFVDLAGDPATAASIEGAFVGRTPAGPQAALGVWTLRSGGDHNVGTGGTLHGGFGVEAGP